MDWGRLGSDERPPALRDYFPESAGLGLPMQEGASQEPAAWVRQWHGAYRLPVWGGFPSVPEVWGSFGFEGAWAGFGASGSPMADFPVSLPCIQE